MQVPFTGSRGGRRGADRGGEKSHSLSPRGGSSTLGRIRLDGLKAQEGGPGPRQKLQSCPLVDGVKAPSVDDLRQGSGSHP